MFPYRDRLPEAQVDVPIPSPKALQEAKQPADALTLLGSSSLLRCVVADVGDLVVGHGDRNQDDVLALAA
jgi:hypothetical protein